MHTDAEVIIMLRALHESSDDLDTVIFIVRNGVLEAEDILGAEIRNKGQDEYV